MMLWIHESWRHQWVSQDLLEKLCARRKGHQMARKHQESCGVAACRVTSGNYKFPSSHRRFKLPLHREVSRAKDSRGKAIAATPKNRNIIWEKDISNLFLSWSDRKCLFALSVGDFLMAQTALFDCRQILLFTPVRILSWPHSIILKNPRVMSVSDVRFHPARTHRPQISFMPASCREQLPSWQQKLEINQSLEESPGERFQRTTQSIFSSRKSPKVMK